MNFIRTLLFFPVSLSVISLIYWGFEASLKWFVQLSFFWMFLIFFLTGGFLWGLLKGLTALIICYTSKLTPYLSLRFYTIVIISCINGIAIIIKGWGNALDHDGWKAIVGAIMFSVLVIQLTIAMIHGAATSIEEDY